jgi:hypothetical protein
MPPVTRVAPAIPAEDSAAALIDLADRLAAGLRLFKGDAALALWLFDHAGGEPAVREFADQVNRALRNPREEARLVELAPSAARLLEAAVLLANVVSSLGLETPADDEVKSNAPNLEPVTRI